MTLEEIAQLQIQDVMPALCGRLLPDEQVTIKKPLVNYVEGEKVYVIDWYVELEATNLPTEVQFLDEFHLYQTELALAESARLDEVERVDNLMGRFQALKTKDAGFPVFHAKIENTPNAELYLVTAIKDPSRKDEIATLMDELEANQDVLDIKKAKKDSRNVKKALGKRAKNCCNDVLELIYGHIGMNLTESETDMAEINFAAVVGCLQMARPTKAKQLIENSEIDGSVLTQELYDDILEEFNEHGF